MPDSGPGRSDRRDFFREALRRMAVPVSDAMDAIAPSTPRERVHRLRPPGALPEADFLNTCFRSGTCMDVCPANAIRPMRSDDPNLSGTPVVIPSQGACVICTDLSCMRECPSGALKLVERTAIRMGLAVLVPDRCVRLHGEDCTECIDFCPIGLTAIEIATANLPMVHPDACTGCGMCEQVCPTSPKAIVVWPLPEPPAD